MKEAASWFTVRETRLPPAFDLLAACARHPTRSFLFERDGNGVAAEYMGDGIGEDVAPATEQAIADLGRRTLETLRSFPATGGAGLVALGSIPYASRGGAHLGIPPRVIRRSRRDETWLVELVPADGGVAPFEPIMPSGARPAEPFVGALLEYIPRPEVYAEAVDILTSRIRDGLLRKAVLARALRVDAGRPLDPVRLAGRLRSVDPDCYVFTAPVRYWLESDPTPGPPPAIVGASPELLVALRGHEVRSTPLAGSAPRAGDPDEDRANADALVASHKNREEHAIVVEAVAETLRPVCEQLTWAPEPALRGTANVWHLATEFRGVTREPAPNVVELVAALHPTPAVCGTPRDAAAAAIEELEPFERGSYAGPIGWMDANGDGEWAIALRCAELRGDRALLYAGAGIVEGSVPIEEIDETERKFRSFLDALRWG